MQALCRSSWNSQLMSILNILLLFLVGFLLDFSLKYDLLIWKQLMLRAQYYSFMKTITQNSNEVSSYSWWKLHFFNHRASVGMYTAYFLQCWSSRSWKFYFPFQSNCQEHNGLQSAQSIWAWVDKLLHIYLQSTGKLLQQAKFLYRVCLCEK